MKFDSFAEMNANWINSEIRNEMAANEIKLMNKFAGIKPELNQQMKLMD